MLSIKVRAHSQAHVAGVTTTNHHQTFKQHRITTSPSHRLLPPSQRFITVSSTESISEIPLPFQKSHALCKMAASPADNARKIEEAEKIKKSDPAKAEEIYKEILTQPPSTNEASIKNLETALVSLGELYRDQKRTEELANLILQTRSALSSFAKSKTAKLGTSILRTGKILCFLAVVSKSKSNSVSHRKANYVIYSTATS
jgi:hypothetical protein